MGAVTGVNCRMPDKFSFMTEPFEAYITAKQPFIFFFFVYIIFFLTVCWIYTISLVFHTIFFCPMWGINIYNNIFCFSTIFWFLCFISSLKIMKNVCIVVCFNFILFTNKLNRNDVQGLEQLFYIQFFKKFGACFLKYTNLYKLWQLYLWLFKIMLFIKRMSCFKFRKKVICSGSIFDICQDTC